ncbi:MAG: Luciferase-like monooxygenase YhbW [uncultured Caballeronia sp.]|nr:MAG: Luciferase-like monooxygenase YhbW [uncultured Caballeronia sp.]
MVIGHVAAGTSTIRVGSGGVMLPNHAPLVIAEQFGHAGVAVSRAYRSWSRPRARHRPDDRLRIGPRSPGQRG